MPGARAAASLSIHDTSSALPPKYMMSGSPFTCQACSRVPSGESMKRLSTERRWASATRCDSGNRCGWKIRLSCARYMSSGKPMTITAMSVTADSNTFRRGDLLLWVDLSALLYELDGFFFQSLLDVVTHVLRDLHRAEVRPAHRAKVRRLGAFLGQGFVVELPRGVGIEPKVELVLPAELEARFRERVVAQLRAGMALGEVRGVRCDLVRHDAVLHVLLVRQPEVLLGRDVAEHRRAVPADLRRADGAGD